MAAWSGQRFCKGGDESTCLKIPSGVSQSFCDLSHGHQHYSFFVPLDVFMDCPIRAVTDRQVTSDCHKSPSYSPESPSETLRPAVVYPLWTPIRQCLTIVLGCPHPLWHTFFFSCTAYKDLIYSVGVVQTENLLAFCYSTQCVHLRTTKCLVGNNLKFFTSRYAMYYWCSRSCWILNKISRKSWDTHLFQMDVSNIGDMLPPQRL